ncbi:cyclophilin-like fold protein [Rhizobium sp. Leaf341]|uniref:cyclophilin-like fold protein n=1 Tax=Rhizobium sp. Leaf341 TaxID=1736344 RepID=UPI00071285B2|nr:cyclophilin-like fold protein [Rhizobium sp. Leaf341]KQR70024.1 hypothetical protein ASG03_05055 [Rhizobium sp. Leaf341]
MARIAGSTSAALLLTLFMGGSAMARDQIRLSSDWGDVTAELADNAAARALVAMLPVTIEMDDHLRQEKTGDLPTALPEAPRQRAFTVGMLGLWSTSDFVIYYRNGKVPPPGIVVLGQVTGDVSIFDRPGKVRVTVDAAR